MPLGGGVDTLATGGVEDDDERDQVERPLSLKSMTDYSMVEFGGEGCHAICA